MRAVEIADLLVVFESDVIIFSDKDCEFPDTDDPDLDWARWYRRAIVASARQLWGLSGGFELIQLACLWIRSARCHYRSKYQRTLAFIVFWSPTELRQGAGRS
jgi:hypothetical protein